MAGLLGRTWSSWLREVMPSLVKTLRRWYWTVCALMNSRVPISGFDSPSRAIRAIRASWAVSSSSRPASGKVFCLSSGPSKEAVLRVHEKAGHPTEEIYELPVEVE